MGLTRKSFGSIAIELLVNFLLPYLIYVKAEAGIGQVHALLAASLPPIVWSVIEFARKRRVDAVSILVLAGIVLSLLAFFGGGSARFLQLRENLVTGLIGLVFLGSAAIGRPLIYQLARAGKLRKSQAEAEQFEALRAKQHFRHGMTIMTLVWGFGLLVQTMVACLLVFRLSIRHYLIVSPIIGYGTMGGLALWTFWYVKQMKRRGAAAAANATG
jgi:hypothetical protein